MGHGFRRLDGTTCLARRKYEIKMFNSKRGEQFVYLLSTRAGALGITLTGADTVIMYDSDWNPTWDKQAHDRVHRIGQDKEVTIYTLLCKDTVEQRIFQRAAQKLSLNELVLRDETDSKSERKEDVLSQSEVKKMLRCGVMKILESESTVMTEALVDSLIADAHARGQQDNLDQGETEVEREDVDVFNQKLLEIRQFDGKKFSTARETFRSIAEDWAAELSASGAKRESVATVEQVGGYQVKKINRSAADPATTGAGENLYGKSKKKPTKSDPFCLYCGHFGMVGGSPLRPCKCGFACHRSFHEECLDAYIASTTTTAVKTVTLSGVGCTQVAFTVACTSLPAQSWSCSFLLHCGLCRLHRRDDRGVLIFCDLRMSSTIVACAPARHRAGAVSYSVAGRARWPSAETASRTSLSLSTRAERARAPSWSRSATSRRRLSTLLAARASTDRLARSCRRGKEGLAG